MEYVSEGFKRATYGLVIATFILMLLGGYVKAINAGLACPDWPLCYGPEESLSKRIIPDLSDEKIFAEWLHRLWALLNGFYMLGVAFKSYNYRFKVPSMFRLSLVLIILYAAQVIFGGLTVISLLEPLIVTAHLGNAVLIIILQMLIAFLATINSESFNHTTLTTDAKMNPN